MHPRDTSASSTDVSFTVEDATGGLTSLTMSPSAFSPANRDGFRDVTAATAVAAEPGRVQFRVLRRSTVVRTNKWLPAGNTQVGTPPTASCSTRAVGSRRCRRPSRARSLPWARTPPGPLP
jgi:hypothetical protein